MTISPRARETHEAVEARFRTIFGQSPISTQVFAPDGTTVVVNRAWEMLWGVTLDQIAGYNILEDEQLVAKGVMPYIKRGFAGEAVSIPAIKYEPDVTIPDISPVPYRWVSASMYPVRDEEGEIREVVLMHEDITDQVEAEAALRESEARFRAMFEGAPIGISLLDRNGRYLAVNPVRQAMLGYTAAELVGKHFSSITYPEDLAYDDQINAAARETGQDRFQLEKRFVRKDGSVAWTRISVSMVYDYQGEPQYCIALAEDITEWKAVEEERARLLALERASRVRVEQLAAQQAAILGQIAEGIIIADPAGNIAFVNQAARDILGVAELGVPIDRYSDTYHLFTMDGQPYPPEELALARAIRTGETVVNAKARIRRPDGQEIVTEASAAPVLSADGTRLGAVLTVRDITAQYDLERQKDELLSSLAHDLRTPLTTLKGRAQILQRRADQLTLTPEQLRDGLTRIDANATRMVTLINELLDVANIQIGRPLTLVRRPTDLVALVRDVVHEHQQATDQHEIVVQTALAKLIGRWDCDRLERVLANLISNALKYSPEGGTITVAVESDRSADPPAAILTVQDQGIGIPAEDLGHIFERFHRAGNVRARIPGTGIGLAAVREIVEQHGGTVSVLSREGAGTTFTVRLPIPPLRN